MTTMNAEAQKQVLEALRAIEMFSNALVTSGVGLSGETLKAGLEDIRIHAGRALEAAGVPSLKVMVA